MDPLSEIIRSIRLSGGLFVDGQFTAPWSVLAKVREEECRLVVGNPVQTIAYHFVVEGRLLACVEGGEPPIEVAAGEVVLFPRNDTHRLASAANIAPRWAREFREPTKRRIAHGGGGDPTCIVCGFLVSETLFNPLIAGLPPILKLNLEEAGSRDWVEASVRFAAAELANGQLASSSLISKLSELLLTEAVRQYAKTLDAREAGWLTGLSDPKIGRALSLIHADPTTPWSADSLAREVGMSRSAFVSRFTTLVGLPPIRYLTRWRLQTAKLTLRETKATVAQLAHSVGYESEEAFSRAFKREFGLPPSQWRDLQKA